MNIYYLEKAYEHIWNIKYVYNLYYNPYSVLITPKNVYGICSIAYPYIKDSLFQKVISNHRNKEDIKLERIK